MSAQALPTLDVLNQRNHRSDMAVIEARLSALETKVDRIELLLGRLIEMLCETNRLTHKG